MDQKKQPGIRFKNVFLKKMSFSREPNVPENGSLNFNFECQKTLSEDGKSLVFDLGCNISEKTGAFTIACSFIGLFEADEIASNMPLAQFAEENAPALMFPYLREFISSTTLKAGMNPIVLPPINIRALLRANATQEKQILEK